MRNLEMIYSGLNSYMVYFGSTYFLTWYSEEEEDFVTEHIDNGMNLDSASQLMEWIRERLSDEEFEYFKECETYKTLVWQIKEEENE